MFPKIRYASPPTIRTARIIPSDFVYHSRCLLVASPKAVGEQLCLYSLILEQFLKDVLHIVNLCPALKHTAEIAVLLVDNRLIQDVAIESGIGIEWRHAFNLHTRAMKQHGPEPTGLGAYIYLTRL